MTLLNKITIWLAKGWIKKQIERWKKMAEKDQKPFYLSKTVIAGMVAIAIGIASAFGIGGLEAETEITTELILQLTTAVAGLVAIYGRLTAKKKLY